MNYQFLQNGPEQADVHREGHHCFETLSTASEREKYVHE
jgi:hypothetical protein